MAHIITPAGAAEALLNYFAGGALTSDGGSPNTKIDVAAFMGADSTNIKFIRTQNSVIDFTTVGPGGLDTGTVAANQTYNLFAIGGGSGGAGVNSVIASLSASPSFANAAGYSVYRLLGTASTDGSSHLITSSITPAAAPLTTGSVTNNLLAPMAADTIKGNNTGSAASPADLSVSQVLTLLGIIWPPRGYLAGLNLSNDGISPNTVLDISGGQCADSTNAVMITLGAFTKSTAGSWTAGSGNNGMGTGLTVGNNTWYHVFAINKGGASDVYFDTSVTAANAPSGTTAFRRVGSIITDGSAHILAFIQYGDYFTFSAQKNIVSSGAIPTGSRTLETVQAPLGINTLAVVSIELTGTAGANTRILLTDPAMPDSAPTDTNMNLVGPPSPSGYSRCTLWCRTDTNSRVGVRSDNGGTFSMNSVGYIDTRGRFA